MKKTLLISITVSIFLTILACTSDDEPDPELISLERVIYFGETAYLKLPQSIATNENSYLIFVQNSLEHLREQLTMYSSIFSFESIDILADTALVKIDSLVSNLSFEVKSTVRDGRAIQVGRLDNREYFWSGGLFFTHMGSQMSDLTEGSYFYNDGDFIYSMNWKSSEDRIFLDYDNFSDAQEFDFDLNLIDGSGSVRYPNYWHDTLMKNTVLRVVWDRNGGGSWEISDSASAMILEEGSW